MTQRHKRSAETSPGQASSRMKTRMRVVGAVERAYRQAKAQNPSLTHEAVARKLGVSKQQVSKWMSGPGNWTIDTMADILYAIDKAVIELRIGHENERPRRNSQHEWIGAPSLPTPPRNIGYTLITAPSSASKVTTRQNYRTMENPA